MAATGTEIEGGSAHLRRALELAELGRGHVSPNPLVGAVLVRGDEVIGEGHHAELGGLHAERAALTDARLLNQPFRKLARTGRPLVTYKAAMTLDGRVAAPGGDSRWISAVESRELVHRWRAECDAIAVGIGTALADDPLLTARVEAEQPASQPVRVVFDSQARLPLDSALVGSTDEAPLLVVCAPEAPSAQRDALEAAGAEVVVAAGRDSAARLAGALDELGRRELSDLLVEGGPTLAGALFDAGEIDRMRLFMAPVLIGAGEARAVIEGEGARRIAEGLRPLTVSHESIGEDLLIDARLREW